MDTQAVTDTLAPLVSALDDHPYLLAGLILLLSALLAQVVAYLVINVVGRLTRRTGTDVDDQLMDILHRPLFWTVVIFGALIAIEVVKPEPGVVALARSVVYSLLIVTWSRFLLRAQRIVTRAMSQHEGRHTLVRPQTLPLFDNVALILVLAGAAYGVLHVWHIDMTAWIASAGIAGIAVGFAAKDTLANLFSGVFILADAPYKIGDYVVLETGERGKVTHIGIRSTRLLTRDDVEVTIPNAIMGNSRIVNESGGPHLKYRIRIDVGVAYGSDIDEVRRILTEITAEEPEVCDDPEPRIRFRTFGASSLDFQAQCWVENPEIRGRVTDALNTAIYKRFMAEGIEIPFSQHDIYIKEMPRAGASAN